MCSPPLILWSRLLALVQSKFQTISAWSQSIFQVPSISLLLQSSSVQKAFNTLRHHTKDRLPSLLLHPIHCVRKHNLFSTFQPASHYLALRRNFKIQCSHTQNIRQLQQKEYQAVFRLTASLEPSIHHQLISIKNFFAAPPRKLYVGAGHQSASFGSDSAKSYLYRPEARRRLSH